MLARAILLASLCAASSFYTAVSPLGRSGTRAARAGRVVAGATPDFLSDAQDFYLTIPAPPPPPPAPPEPGPERLPPPPPPPPLLPLASLAQAEDVPPFVLGLAGTAVAGALVHLAGYDLKSLRVGFAMEKYTWAKAA